MSLKIILESPPDIAYLPGSVISGHLELTDKKQHNIESLTLLFDGRCKVKITEWHYNQQMGVQNGAAGVTTASNYRSKGMYFVHSLSLDPGSAQSKDGSQAWSFHMTIPEFTEEISEQQLKEHEATTFAMQPPWKGSYSREPHLLPSTFDYHSGGSISLNASVEYELKAILTHPKESYKLFSGNLEATQKIIVKSLGTPMNSNPPLPFETRIHDATVRSLLLLPSHQSGHLSLREKTASLFNKSSLPSFAFRITIHTPGTIFLDSPSTTPLPFLITLTHIPGPTPANEKRYHEQIPTPPPITLKKFRLRLCATTHARSVASKWSRERTTPALTALDIYDAKPQDLASAADSGGDDLLIPCHEQDRGHAQPLDLGARLGITMADIRAAKKAREVVLVPEFATYNIARTYALAWKVVLGIAGQEVEWEVEAKDGMACAVSVLGGDGSGAGGGCGGRDQDGLVMVAPPPPGYGEEGGLGIENGRSPMALQDMQKGVF